jgi:hypothetical protein
MIVTNLATQFGTLAETVELGIAIIMRIGGIILTHYVQKWADKAGEHPAAANIGKGGTEQYQSRSMRE